MKRKNDLYRAPSASFLEANIVFAHRPSVAAEVVLLVPD